MKLNIFQIPSESVASLFKKFGDAGLDAVGQTTMNDWKCTFFFSRKPEPAEVPWIEDFKDFIPPKPRHSPEEGGGQEESYKNLAYFGACAFQKAGRTFVVTFGKAHFYVRPFCDADFGIEVAKRIANRLDTRQTSSKRFAGKRRKQIRSFERDTALTCQSGESVEFIQASVSSEAVLTYGRTAKFGNSVLFQAPVEVDELGDFFDSLVEDCAKDGRFELPRTVAVTDPTECEDYERELRKALSLGAAAAQFESESHSVVGAEFVFSGNFRYEFWAPGFKNWDLDGEEPSVQLLQEYVRREGIAAEDTLDVRLRHKHDGRAFSRRVRECLDFIVPRRNVMLTGGKWVRFNEDYLAQLNRSVDAIEREEVEQVFVNIVGDESVIHELAERQGYRKTDQNFQLAGIKGTRTPVEAFDLLKGKRAYAVKVGTTQGLGYVCDQAFNLLEIKRNNANIGSDALDFTHYCLWLVLAPAKRKGVALTHPRVPENVSTIGSIILKQKLEAFADSCREIGVTPVLKISSSIPKQADSDGTSK